MSESKPRRPRKLLVAGAGLAAISFTTGMNCGTPMGKRVCPPSVCPEPLPGPDGGDGGHAVQYCGIPDGGVPIPCNQLDAGADAGEDDGGASDAG